MSDAIPPSATMSEPLLTVSDIHTYYGDSYVLQGVSLTLHKGQIAAILGRNGMGKTTLIRSVAGLTPPRPGEIVFRGRSLRGKPPYAIAQAGHRDRAAGPAHLPLAQRAREPAAADERAGALVADARTAARPASAGTSTRC